MPPRGKIQHEKFNYISDIMVIFLENKLTTETPPEQPHLSQTITGTVDIFAQLNFRASSPRKHIRVVIFFAHVPFMSFMITIFTHIKFSRI